MEDVQHINTRKGDAHAYAGREARTRHSAFQDPQRERDGYTGVD